MKTILDLNHDDARKYFLKETSYCNFDLPSYFNFQPLINAVSTELNGKLIEEFYLNFDPSKPIKKGNPKAPFPSHFDDVNYRLLVNKDGKYAWRPFQIIHPALYVSLVHRITEEANWNLILSRFSVLHNNPKIICQSMPIESDIKNMSDKEAIILNWYHKVEQESIESALCFDYVLHTDITDCYSSIYTHSIPWALHTKSTAKTNRSLSLIGNSIDRHLQDMSYGQTNGIPQGSNLMDFIAEMVLGYADSELTSKINNEGVTDYKIIRYRDDYRIFANNPQDAELIAKLLTEVLIDLGLKLNPTKTMISNNVVNDSIKPDKRYWLSTKNSVESLQGSLLIIHQLAQQFPNSGSLAKALNSFYDEVNDKDEIKENINVLISILVDIAYKNPRVYPICSAILSKLLSLIEEQALLDDIWDSILKKFEKLPNTGHLKIWLQRITIKIDRAKDYDELLCKKVNDPSITLWNSDWLNGHLKTIINSEVIIDEDVINSLDQIIESEEVSLFNYVIES